MNGIDFFPSLFTTSLDLSLASLASPLNEYSKDVNPVEVFVSFGTTNLEDFLSQFEDTFSESIMNKGEKNLDSINFNHRILGMKTSN